MLVITRKKNEQLVVTPPGGRGNLVLTVVEIRDDKVRIALECGRDWEVHRKEVWDQLHGDESEPI